MAELLLNCQGLTKAYGAEALFEQVSFGIFAGDRVGLVGPNGAGKSTLLKILAGVETPDAGQRTSRRHLRLGYVGQVPSFPAGSTVESTLSDALAGQHLDAAEQAARVAVTLGKAGFDDPRRAVDALSGGWRKRLAVARELVSAPELLLLDEPTNHLDVEGILWLQELLASEPAAFLAVSHDRYFLEAVTRRVLELNRVFPGGLLDVKGNYSRFLEKKDELLRGQVSYQQSLAGRVRDELAWLRRKAKARTRKAQARVREAHRLAEELDDLRARTATASAGIAFNATGRRSQRLLETEGLSKAFGDEPLIGNLDLLLTPGERLGLLGSNGSGKTTLLRLLAGELPPDSGRITRAHGLRVVVFDQHREHLDASAPLRRALAPEGDAVTYQGRSIHVAGWAQRFLFRTQQLETPVGRLSGGEQARVLIARLMLQPADVLLLDEPTNDLDIPTLEVLEESLLEFSGALVLVTHDRYLLDRVSTRILALEPGGAIEYADCAQWEAAVSRVREAGSAAPEVKSATALAAATAPRPRRLSYLEQREWAQMEPRVLEAEEQHAACLRALEDPHIATDATALQERTAELEAARGEVERLYARWAELEAKQK